MNNKSNNGINSSRRDFFKQTVGVLGGLIAAPALLRAMWSSVANAEEVKYVKEGVGMAASVNYTEHKNRSKVKKELQTDRGGVKFAAQKCDACMLYTKDAKGNYGKCTLFPNEFVKNDSWCSSWTKKV
jgi:hypothetical protein